MRTAVAFVAALALVGAAAAASPVKTLTAGSGAVQAKLTYRWGGTFSKDVRIRIRRNGSLALDRTLPKIQDLPVKLRVRDLEADGEPEVIADFYTGGAHCCWYSLIYGYKGPGYGSIRQDWTDAYYTLKDLDGDGTAEFVSSDNRFAYVFTAYAGSAFPIQIWNYKAGRLVDTTRTFRPAVRNDARSLWRGYLRNRRSSYPDARGILAAWMADQYQLGQQRSGWATMRKLNARGEFGGLQGGGDIWPKGDRYLKALRKFLIKLGYAP